MPVRQRSLKSVLTQECSVWILVRHTCIFNIYCTFVCGFGLYHSLVYCIHVKRCYWQITDKSVRQIIMQFYFFSRKTNYSYRMCQSYRLILHKTTKNLKNKEERVNIIYRRRINNRRYKTLVASAQCNLLEIELRNIKRRNNFEMKHAPAFTKRRGNPKSHLLKKPLQSHLKPIKDAYLTRN